ncbi:hypothetical protein PR202_gb29049 [Eleusine coracana subsp. coracana]|uniref:DNA repair metallo-beta-lactamase domain-containing protein n=1 Tax=Eleusine coracana subsp. coracana TaxID=191504 RepID=A0AAV5FW13_ELECO|nr:hypothetical protein PR202_gb29049 [Eleusine coracana subsp. coracana]
MPVDVARILPFAVDTWTPASSLKRHRFLTHAHRDYLVGIATAAAASIYATRLTILIALRICPDLDRAAFVEMEAGAPPLRVPDPDGDFTVAAFDANHCPGAVMFLFESPAFGTILHTGDCRLTPECLHTLPLQVQGRVDYVYLDCTFARCPLPFPSKEDSIRQVINCIWRHPNAPAVYLACDMLGQEDVLIEVSRTFGSKIHVDVDKTPDCHANLSLVAPDILTADAAASRFHVMAFPGLAERAAEILALARARGQPEPLIPMRDEVGVWHVCLSMHSSRDELERALEVVRPRWVVSTTPPVMAMDLSYVKKHCSLSRFAPDDPIWKVLGITTDAMSRTVVTGSPPQSSVETIEKSEVAVTCSVEEFGSDESRQVVEVAAEPTLESS